MSTASKPKEKIDTTGLIRIGEVARRSGVARGTIQHYVREGLLPTPVKTFRNMAYYEPSTVDRIRIIKELQEKSYMPLSEIREMLGNGEDEQSNLVEAIVHAQDAALRAISPAARGGELTLRDAARRFGLRAGLVEEFAQVGFIHAYENENGETCVGGVDLEVLAAVERLKGLGFTERVGFSAEDLMLYKRHSEELLQDELQTFMRVLSKKKKANLTPKLARSAIEGATMLLLAVRKQSIANLLGVESAPKPKGKKRG